MTRDEAVALLNARLKRGSNTSLDSTIITEMKLVQSRFEGAAELPWFLLTSDYVTLTTTADDDKVAISADFLREFEDDGLWVYDSDDTEDWILLTKDTMNAIVAYYAGEDTALPQAYDLVHGYFRLRPIPDDAYTLRYMYYKADTVLSTNVENQWLKYAADLMIAETGWVVATYVTRDKEAAAAFASDRDLAMDRVWRENEARKHAKRQYIMQYGQNGSA